MYTRNASDKDIENTVVPTVSVIVPVYNVQSYLPFCIESILKQSFTDIEVLLVDAQNCATLGLKEIREYR